MQNVGIHAINRYDLPKKLIPKDAEVEISAKIDSGYHVSDKNKK